MNLDNMKLFKTLETSFDRFDTTIHNFLVKSFNDIGLQYSGMQMFEIMFKGVKGVMQNIMFYIEDAFTEQNIQTAVRKRSIFSLARLSGYEPYFGTAATGLLTGRLFSNTNLGSDIKNIYINNHATVVNKNTGLPYIIMLQGDKYVIDINKPLMNYQFNIVQGSYGHFKYVARGENLETIEIKLRGLFDKQYIEVYVNNEKWTEVGNLYEMHENGHEYVLNVGYTSDISITFGNGIYGSIIPAGTYVQVDYLIHVGPQGNIYDLSSAKFEFSDYGYDFEGNNINIDDYLMIDCTNYVSGGTMPDTIDNVRKMVGYNSRSNVLASVENYKLFFSHFSFLGTFNIWSENNSMSIIVNPISNVLKRATSTDEYINTKLKDLYITDYQKSTILNSLKNSNKTFAGITVKFEDPIIVQYAIICYINCSDMYYKDTLKESVYNVIINFFRELPYNTLFIAKSTIINKIIENVDNIKSIDIDIISEYNETAFANGYYYAYESRVINNNIEYYKVKYNYESASHLGLDDMGNIQLNNNIYIPVLHGDFHYYPDKTQSNNALSMLIKPIEFIFI